MIAQSKNNKSNYLIDPTCTKVNRLFVLSESVVGENNTTKTIK